MQVTTASNTSARVKKIMHSDNAMQWLDCNSRHSIVVHAWKRGLIGRATRWKLTETLITIEDMMSLRTSDMEQPNVQ